MATIILSIHKPHCEALFARKKYYEFRKSLPKRPVTSILVYEAKGCGKIIGELAVAETLVDSPENIWEMTKDKAGVDKDSFFTYFKNKDRAVAFVVEEAIRYEEPVALAHFGVSNPPQNYIWIEEKLME